MTENSGSRKFDQHGDWHFLLAVFRLPLLMLLAPKRFLPLAQLSFRRQTVAANVMRIRA